MSGLPIEIRDIIFNYIPELRKYLNKRLHEVWIRKARSGTIVNKYVPSHLSTICRSLILSFANGDMTSFNILIASHNLTTGEALLIVAFSYNSMISNISREQRYSQIQYLCSMEWKIEETNGICVSLTPCFNDINYDERILDLLLNKSTTVKEILIPEFTFVMSMEGNDTLYTKLAKRIINYDCFITSVPSYSIGKVIFDALSDNELERIVKDHINIISGAFIDYIVLDRNIDIDPDIVWSKTNGFRCRELYTKVKPGKLFPAISRSILTNFFHKMMYSAIEFDQERVLTIIPDILNQLVASPLGNSNTILNMFIHHPIINDYISNNVKELIISVPASTYQLFTCLSSLPLDIADIIFNRSVEQYINIANYLTTRGIHISKSVLLSRGNIRSFFGLRQFPLHYVLESLTREEILYLGIEDIISTQTHKPPHAL